MKREVYTEEEDESEENCEWECTKSFMFSAPTIRIAK